MREREIVAAVVEYYETKLASFGTTARGVDWKDEVSQARRFEQLIRALRIDERSSRFTILDFGCGYGALLPYLTQRGFDFGYTGYDRSARMIAEGRRQYAGVAGAVFTCDWESVPPTDYVVGSGVFNVRLETSEEDWSDYVMRTLAMLDEKAIAGWSANFLTRYADEDRKRVDLYYADPAVIFNHLKSSLSKGVSLLHDYDLYEFTIGVVSRLR